MGKSRLHALAAMFRRRRSEPIASDPALGTLTVPAADLPYRLCVGIMLINRDGLVWTGRRLPKWSEDKSAYIWQMPQGGIAPGEDAHAAALRELEEETSVHSVELLAEAPGWHTYDLPQELLGIALKGRYRGQKQKWFAMRFLGDDAEIDIAPRLGRKAEFDAWRWARTEDLPGLVVAFKRHIYEDVVTAFAPLTSRGRAGPVAQVRSTSGL